VGSNGEKEDEEEKGKKMRKVQGEEKSGHYHDTCQRAATHARPSHPSPLTEGSKASRACDSTSL